MVSARFVNQKDYYESHFCVFEDRKNTLLGFTAKVRYIGDHYMYYNESDYTTNNMVEYGIDNISGKKYVWEFINSVKHGVSEYKIRIPDTEYYITCTSEEIIDTGGLSKIKLTNNGTTFEIGKY